MSKTDPKEAELQNMNKRILKAEENIARQTNRLAQLEADNHDATTAKALLAEYTKALGNLQAHRQIILQELAQGHAKRKYPQW